MSEDAVRKEEQKAPELTHYDVICWQEAIGIHNSNQKGPESSKYIRLSSVKQEKATPKEHARELMAAALNSYQVANKKRGLPATLMIQICHNVRQYSRAIDAFIQSDPGIAGLVWGSIRIGEEQERASRIASEGIIEIIRHAGRWEQVSALSGLLDSTRIRIALVALYVTVLDFLLSATKWLKRSTLKRIGISILNSKGDKFQEKMDQMKRAAALVDRELQTFGLSLKALLTSIGPGLVTLHAIGSELDVLMDKMDGILCEARNLSDYVSRLDHELLTSTGQTSSSVQLVLAGSGKSVMAGYLEDHLTARGNNMLLSYRFQRSASNTQSTPTSFAGSLVYQLLAKSPAFVLNSSDTAIRELQALIARFPLGPQNCSFSTIWAVASSLLSKKLASQCVLIIDAMDECLFDRPSEPGIIPFLQTLLETVRTSNVKLVVFTRPEEEFMRFLKPQSIPSIFLSHDLLFPDIARFAQVEYESMGLPNSELTKVMEFVSHSACGSFRWVELFLNHLGQSVTVEELRARIRVTLPPSIENLHRQAMTAAMQTFGPTELSCRRSLLLIIFQAQRPLKTAEIKDALSLLPEKADLAIARLCKPLASTYGGILHLSHPSVREFFEELCQKADESLGIRFSDSDSLLAERSLTCLMDERYADLGRIASYLTANNDENFIMDENMEPPNRDFFDYAFRFWDHHLVRVKQPRAELLQLFNRFITSLQFAYWSEKSRKDCGQLVRVNVVRNSLFSWHKKLSKEHQALVELDKFFELPYSLLSKAYTAGSGDNASKVLPWLSRMTIGDYYLIAGLTDRLTETREAVYKELHDILGPRHRLTLRAHSDLAFIRILDGKMWASHNMCMKALSMQRDVYGEHSQGFLEICGFKGQSEFYMADFVAAVITFTKLSAETLSAMGPDSWLYLTGQWWLAQGLAYLGQLEPALRTSDSVVKKRRGLFGPSDSFADIVQITVGEIQLLLGQRDEAIASITEVVCRAREERSLSESVFRLDGEFVLAVAYYTAGGKDGEALAIVDEIEPVIKSRRFDYQRHCQLIHLKSLLLVRGNKLDEAIHLLQSALTQTEADQENRILLWVRLDLATLLRARNATGDLEQAAANFDNLVKDVSGEEGLGFPDEPDPPRFWEAAERALRLVRDRKHLDAKRELEAEGLEWKRGSDFWLWLSGNFCKDLLRVEDRDSESLGSGNGSRL
ncbi:hypothetical protein QBC43DRAFT_201581 [Cladorrhinum sp. PSN259]|nr:hypothetical protein QBC43DRAFT_201581 [Cladorrhinum sp. PSN259]